MKQKQGARVKQEKSGEIQKLKNQVKRLQKDKKELISKLRTLEAVLEKNVKVLKGSVEDISVEELIAGAKEEKTIKEIKSEKVCPNCGSSNYKVMEIRGGKIGTCPDCTHRGKI